MKFLLDMGIGQSVAVWLRGQGIDAKHLNDEGLHMLPDDLIIEKAIAEDRIIITADNDFGQLLAKNKISSISVIHFRTSSFIPKNIQIKLEIVLEQFSAHLRNKTIITVEDERIRFRKLPI